MDLICFSHLRWNFVYQRPQHLLTRFSKHYRVYYIEEPEIISNDEPSFRLQVVNKNLTIVTPLRSGEAGHAATTLVLQALLSDFFKAHSISPDIFWYYTPMALKFTSHFVPNLVVYDCMDELSNFKFAPAELKQLEKDLFAKADVVFTGGHSLYKAKMNQHGNIWPVPSSIDKEHFMQARRTAVTPRDQANIPGPRIGFYGVIDERFDLDLVKDTAEKRPDWQFIILGPVIKIDPEDLPRLPNIHYLGPKSYEQLPSYLAGWDVAMIPFLLNEATRYISPTKTPEYLAAAVPVISTAIEDVVKPYGINMLANIVSNADEFIAACEAELQHKDRKGWLRQVDHFLANDSWDATWQFMQQRINERNQNKHLAATTIATSITQKIQAHV